MSNDSPASSGPESETATPSTPTYGLPTRPFNVIAAINRMAAATGSIGYASAAANADYNGHHVTVNFNEYRGYWIAEYFWAGRNVLARGSLRDALRAAKQEYDRGALGASVSANYPTSLGSWGNNKPTESAAEFVALCEEFGFMTDEAQKAHHAAWWTPLHEKVTDAMSYERHGLAPAVGFLANSKTVEEYEAKLNAFFEERKARMREQGPGVATLRGVP